MTVQSILTKLRNQFKLSAAEVDRQELCQSAVIAAAAIVSTVQMADGLMERIICFVEENSEAQITKIEKEIRWQEQRQTVFEKSRFDICLFM